jgi:hypothetical protein
MGREGRETPAGLATQAIRGRAPGLNNVGSEGRY